MGRRNELVIALLTRGLEDIVSNPRKFLERTANCWCRAFHPGPMWPIHRHYQCPKCFRVYRICW